MISSRTPEGFPIRCAVCGRRDFIKPSTFPNRDAPCPHCGSLLWVEASSTEANTEASTLFEMGEEGDVTIVRFIGPNIVGERNVQVIGDQLFDLVDNQGKKKILLSFRNVKALSSAALGKLITLNKKTQQSGGKLVMCGISKEISEVFAITKLDQLFNISKDE
ncbi:MAG TPA: STAS domain-containing protein [Gemmataceae bacterium]|jgi:anti-sigma B factor antagonist|nr:STAS domain-containing protein [Gemmataceae bacterium]